MQFLAWAALLPLALAVAPVIQPRAAQHIPGNYIVKLKEGAPKSKLQDTIRQLSVQAKHVYQMGGFKGFAATLSPQALEIVRKLPEVEYIEQDAVITSDSYVSQAIAEVGLLGLSRLSSRTPFSYAYVYDDSAGEGTCAYIFDSGIYVNHNDFGGRATWLANFVDTNDTDPTGHGTHVAGTVGGRTYGVAKKTKLFAVKVLGPDGRGNLAGILAGINLVVADAAVRIATGQCPKGVVANMSLNTGNSVTFNLAVAVAVTAGVFFAVSAGNEGKNAQLYSPGSEPSVCTVGAADHYDVKASFSNFGAGVDVFAPGVDVLSTSNEGVDATKYRTGTSMASPHIAGLAAYLLALLGPKTPVQLCQYIKDTATVGAITGLPAGTPNRMAFNGNPSA